MCLRSLVYHYIHCDVVYRAVLLTSKSLGIAGGGGKNVKKFLKKDEALASLAKKSKSLITQSLDTVTFYFRKI